MADSSAQFVEEARKSLHTAQYQQALDLANQAIELAPESDEAHLARAIALSQLNQQEAATAAFRQAMEANPSSARARYNFAVHLYSQGKREEARIYVHEAVELEPAHSAGQELLKRIESELGGAPARTKAGPPPIALAAGRLAWVSGMGPVWQGLAITFAVVNIVTLLPLVGSSDSTWSGPLQISFVVGIFSAIWVGIDIYDRRGSWLWMVLAVLCSAAPIIVLPLYLVLGRGQNAKAG